MKRITKKICSTVCTLLAFSGNRGGALTKEALHLTKEILCNAGQWFAIYPGYNEYYGIFHEKREKDGKYEWVPNNNLTRGQKAFGYVIGAATFANAVDAAKRSHDIAHDVIKGSNNKSYTTDKKESKNYWPTLEATSGVVHFGYALYHNLICTERFCYSTRCTIVVGLASLADAYFRYRESNQSSSESPIPEKKETTQQNLTSSNPKNSKDLSSDKK